MVRPHTVQSTYLDEIGDMFDGQVRATVPPFNSDVRGVDALRRASEALFALTQGRSRLKFPCYTPALTARTGRSSASTATERVRDGASRAGPEA
jgi:hypothetical protein